MAGPRSGRRDAKSCKATRSPPQANRSPFRCGHFIGLGESGETASASPSLGAWLVESPATAPRP